LPITPPGFRPGKPEYIHGSKLEPVPFLLHWLFSKHAHRLQILLINNTSGKNPKTEDRILRAQRNIVVHLVLTALGAVAVKTQGLVGHQLLAARVDSGTNGNTKL
jgi:hypothetical protein